MQLRVGSDRTIYGVGRDANIVTATLRALVSAVNRAASAQLLAVEAPAPVRTAVA